MIKERLLIISPSVVGSMVMTFDQVVIDCIKSPNCRGEIKHNIPIREIASCPCGWTSKCAPVKWRLAGMLPREWKMCTHCVRVSLNPMTGVIIYL